MARLVSTKHFPVMVQCHGDDNVGVKSGFARARHKFLRSSDHQSCPQSGCQTLKMGTSHNCRVCDRMEKPFHSGEDAL